MPCAVLASSVGPDVFLRLRPPTERQESEAVLRSAIRIAERKQLQFSASRGKPHALAGVRVDAASEKAANAWGSMPPSRVVQANGGTLASSF